MHRSEPDPPPTEFEVIEALEELRGLIGIHPAVTAKGDEVKCWLPDSDTGWDYYLGAEDCADLAHAFHRLSVHLRRGNDSAPRAPVDAAMALKYVEDALARLEGCFGVPADNDPSIDAQVTRDLWIAQSYLGGRVGRRSNEATPESMADFRRAISMPLRTDAEENRTDNHPPEPATAFDEEGANEELDRICGLDAIGASSAFLARKWPHETEALAFVLARFGERRRERERDCPPVQEATDLCAHPEHKQQAIKYEHIEHDGTTTVARWCGACGSLRLGRDWHAAEKRSEK